MGLQLHGWVEIQDLRYSANWEAAINVYSLGIGRINELFIRVFGIMPSSARAEDEFHPIAPARGVPADASGEVSEWNPEGIYTGYVGHTWILWSELAETPWGQGNYPSGEPLPSNWQMLFAMMALLAKEFGQDHVRLVAWFG